MKFHIRKHDRFGPLLNLVEKKAKPIQQCKVPSCPFETDRSNDLKKHMARHDKYGPQWRSVLKRHMPLQHCSVPACSFSTTRSQDIRRHMRRHDKGTVPLDIPKKRDPVDSPATGNLDTSNSSAPKDLDTSNPSASGNLDTSNPSASRNLDSNELSVEVNLDPEGFRAQMKPDPTDFSAFVDPHPRDLSGQEIFDLNDFGVEVKPDPSDSSAQEKPGPSAQEKHDSSNTTSQEKPESSDTTSQQKPESSDSISQQKPESSDTTSQEKHDSSDTTSQEKHDSSDTTSQQKPESSATSSQEKPELSDSSSQEKHDPSESKAHEKCHASDSRAKYKAKRYRCNVPLCTFATNRVHEMLHHMKRNQRHGPQSGAVEKQAKLPQCCKEPTCFFATTNPNDMKRHMEWHTKRARQERSPKPFWIPHAERSYRNGCQVLHCRVGDCTYTCYTTSHNLLRHMHNRHSSFMANIEMPLKARKGPAQTTISHLCDQCGMAYKTESGLRLHKEKVHMGYSRYRCEKCDTGFVTKGHFSHHMLQHEDVTCSVCGETLPGKKELQLHMKTTHPSPTHLACEEEGCLAVFSQKSQLTRHILSKHKGRNFVCPVCGLTLTYSFTLIRHMRTCHKMTVPLQRPGVRKRR
ncbi:zinc finger protein 37-like [Littorina saxatilis]